MDNSATAHSSCRPAVNSREMVRHLGGLAERIGFRRPPPVSFPEFSPAAFAWSDGAEVVRFEVLLLGMGIDRGAASVEMRIEDHDIRIVAMLDRAKYRTDIYLGNYLIVPPPMRRRGFATAALAAMCQCLDVALQTPPDPRQKFYLQGTFIDRGIDFSKGICSGVVASKATPAPINFERLSAAALQLQMERPPVQIAG